jgi:ferric-chelate reductase
MAQDFAALKTPPAVDDDGAPPSSHAKTFSLVPIATALRLATLLMIATFVFGNIGTWAPLYELQLINTFTKWWNGYPHGDKGGGHAGHSGSVMDTGVQRDISHTGHTEMVRPTFLFLFCILPFFLSLLLIEALQFVAPARRATATLLWSSAKLLRRKPTLPLLGLSRLTVGEWLFGVLYVVGGNVLCMWYQWDRRIDLAHAAKNLTTTKYWNIIGISNGYLCIYNMAFLLLPVTRNCVWMEFFNISYANGVKFHRWIGFATVITGVIHTLGYWVKWVRDGTWQKYQLPCFHCDITKDPEGYYPWFNTFGFISVLALVLMIPTSLPVVRRKLYEWFYISHWVLFLISFFFAILHWGLILWWILPAGLLFFISRAASSWNALAPIAVQSISVLGDPASGELVQLVVQRFSTSPTYDYKAGQFVYLNVPSISKLQWHALTIASSPRSSATHLTLLVKPLGDWSTELVAYAHECIATNATPVVFMDGFYGASLELYDEYKTLCLVGGGIGVTPLLAVLEHIAAKVAAAKGDWQAAGQPRVVLALAFREVALLRAVAPVVLKLKELDPSGDYFQTTLASSQPMPGDAAMDAPYLLAPPSKGGKATTSS